jgi:hypothetical protein
MKKHLESTEAPQYWSSLDTDAHRRGISDMAWARMQPQTPAKYKRGDVVEFMVGGYGQIDDVSDLRSTSGWPVSYSVVPVCGLPFHSKGVYAWHYEGDIKRLFAVSKLILVED